MRLEIAYSTTYRYTPAATHGLTALRMRPRERAGLLVSHARLRVTEGGSVVRSYVDGWGTQADVAEAAGRHEVAQFDVEALVETATEMCEHDPSLAELLMYRRDSSRVRAEAVSPITEQLQLDPSSWGSVEVVLSCLPQWFSYRVGATDAQTPMEAVVESRAGVCQDFAHIMIAVLQSWGWAARYVSGYVYTVSRAGGRIEADAMHAWVQAYRPEFGWVGIDPTTASYADDTYVPVAFGRDYDDIRPVRGMLSGPPAAQSQEARLSVTLIQQQ